MKKFHAYVPLPPEAIEARKREERDFFDWIRWYARAQWMHKWGDGFGWTKGAR